MWSSYHSTVATHEPRDYMIFGCKLCIDLLSCKDRSYPFEESR
jgi:hypothetical protein